MMRLWTAGNSSRAVVLDIRRQACVGASKPLSAASTSASRAHRLPSAGAKRDQVANTVLCVNQRVLRGGPVLVRLRVVVASQGIQRRRTQGRPAEQARLRRPLDYRARRAAQRDQFMGGDEDTGSRQDQAEQTGQSQRRAV